MQDICGQGREVWRMKYSLLISGTGGQGVLSAGASLAATAAFLGYATFVPWYGMTA